MSSSQIRIGIDTGGTFTDFVVYYPAEQRVDSFKLLSTPHNPAEAVLAGLQQIAGELAAGSRLDVVHGSTVATNALLERKGPPTALVTTRGFRDVLQIGRQNRPALYDFFANPPDPLVPVELRLEVDERVAATGEVLQPLDARQAAGLAGQLRELGVKTVAVCLLFSFLHPQHERMLGESLRREGFNVSLSSEILPEYREYERTSTTTVNAYVSPVLDAYLGELEDVLADQAVRLRVMQSNGGQISLGEARRAGVRCILSGPAGGVIGAEQVARLADARRSGQADFAAGRLITFDMGGTSTDVSLISGAPRLTTESIVGGMPIGVPVLDIHTIGAGGGSIASVDLGGALRVGPHSAGADPGPACYGRGDLPTVTDANLVLGRLAPDYFLGGQMLLDPQRARKALGRLGEKLGMSAEAAAWGVIEVVNAHMERALRLISVERGHDPGRASGNPFTLVSFGGAGGLHAADLARRLDLPWVLIPPLASTLSAFGMLAAEVVRDYSLTVMLPNEAAFPQIVAALRPLLERGRQDLLAEGLVEQNVRLEPLLDVRYRGQSYELKVPFQENQDWRAAFHAAHQQAYGYHQPDSALEVVNVRVRAVGSVPPPPLHPLPHAGADPSPARLGLREVHLQREMREFVPFYRYEDLLPGNRLPGPAVIVRSDTSIWLDRGDEAGVDEYLNLWIALPQTRV
jgi:N-methylhydantoinase A